MNASRLGLIFSMVFLCVMLPDYQRTMELNAVNTLQNAYNRALEQAVEDAVTELAEEENEGIEERKKEKVVKRFFTSLAINMNKMHNKNDRERLYQYVPIVLIVKDEKLFVGSQLWEPIWEEYAVCELEYTELEEWCCMTDGVGFAAFFQGCPYGNEYTGYYDFVAFKGARLEN